VGKPSQVDETLFGNTGKNIIQGSLGGAQPINLNSIGTSAVQVRNLPEEAQKVVKQVREGDYSHPEVMLLPASELERMKVICHWVSVHDQSIE
jgi:hypothetical protein